MTVSVLTQADLDPLLARIAALEARPAGSASGFDFRLVESGPEVDFQIPVLPYPQTQWRNVYVRDIGPLKANDLVIVTTTGEVRNDTNAGGRAGYNVEFAIETLISPRALFYHTDDGSAPELVPPYQSGAYMLSPVNGTDVDMQQHYYQIGRTESWRAPVDMPTALLYCRVRCRSTAAQAGDYCTIMQNGYGEMNAAIFSRGRAP